MESKLKEFSKNYLNLAQGEYAGINLTRIDDFNDFYLKQVVDSVCVAEKSKVFKTCLEGSKYIVDVGFGGGFPILPLATIYPEKKFIGIDARGKKVQVVGEIANKLEIKNAKFFHERIENIYFDRDVLIVFKAVGKVSDFLPLISGNSNLLVFFYKGPNFYELEDIEDCLKNWEIIEELSYDVPGTDGRLLIGFKNKNVPRGTKQISKKIIKFSSLL